MEYHGLRLDDETYDALDRLAKSNNRTLVGQIRHMLQVFEAMNIQTVEYLPRPADAKSIPIVTIEK